MIFDLDDTLFDHSGSVRTALASWLPAVPATDPSRLTEAWFDLEHLHYDAGEPATFPSPNSDGAVFATSRPQLNRRIGPDDDLDALFATYLVHYERAWQTLDDARPALVELNGLGYVTAVLTNGATTQQKAKVERIGLGDLLTEVITSAELGIAKPDLRSNLIACNISVSNWLKRCTSATVATSTSPAHAPGFRSSTSTAEPSTTTTPSHTSPAFATYRLCWQPPARGRAVETPLDLLSGSPVRQEKPIRVVAGLLSPAIESFASGRLRFDEQRIPPTVLPMVTSHG